MCPRLGGDIFVASAFSVLMLVIIKLCADTEFPLGESKSIYLFTIVAKAYLALAARSRERSFLYFIRETAEVCF